MDHKSVKLLELILLGMIDNSLLTKYGAIEKHYAKDEVVFFKNDVPRFYFQVVSGEVKMNSYNEAGKEFIQGIFSAGRSFGEPPLFGDFDYPANAVALEESTLLVLRKELFHTLLLENPKVHLKFTEVLANRLYYKATMASGNSSNTAEDRVIKLIDYLKFQVYKIPAEDLYEVELTRQQIADLTGLRVETVIRVLKKMDKSGEIRIQNRKVYR